MKKQQKRIRSLQLKRKTVLSRFLLFIIPSLAVLMIILFGVLYFQEKEKRTKLISDYSLELTKANANEINILINSLILELKQIANRNIVKSMNWDLCGKDLAKIAESRNEIYGFFALMNPDGSYYTTLNGKETKNLSTQRYFIEVFNDRKDYAISNPYVSVTNNRPIFLINIPVVNNDKVVGSLAGIVYLETLSDVAKKIQLGGLGFGFMVDNAGKVFAHPSEKVAMKLNLLEADAVGYTNMEKVGKEILHKESGFGNVVGPDGTRMVLYFNQIPGTPGWSLGIALPEAKVMQEVNKLLYVFMVYMIVLLGGIILLIWRLSVDIITRPLNKLIDYVSDVAEGHLYRKIEFKSKDEVGQMAASLDKMSTKIKSIVENIRDSSAMIAGNSKQLNVAAEQISQGANEQASSSEEISSSMEEMAATIDQNAQNAQLTEKIALNVAQGVEKVSVAAEKSLNSVRSIVEKIGVIGEIAEKTDLLAINAAVEAARAGQYGKGFAVVASEVRKLAEYSQKAASAIVSLSEESLKTTEEAGNLMQSIIPDITKNAELVREISAASIEQNAGATQINQGIQQLSTITQQNASSAEELASSSVEMSSQAENLKEMVSFFKINPKEVNSVSQIFDMIEKHNNEIVKLKQQLNLQIPDEHLNGLNGDDSKKEGVEQGVQLELVPDVDNDSDYEKY